MSVPEIRPSAPELEGLRWSIEGLAGVPEAALMAFNAFDPHFREAWTEAQMAGLLSTASAWLELARRDGEPVAFALCRQAQEDVELLLCATRPGWRRAGLGRALVEHVADSARARGGHRLFLEVRASNAAALALYQASGFSVLGRRPGYYRTVTGESIDAITLGRDL